ncbi:YbhB/YbcL family Raf kinase inhibitor-like protein [Stenoxybacter acetivorans]|uniref:YbhB/YbcL family Raf kinase inhibitor-like protein n=1 Tax=Stenoxybacter acetivorans TaxID=422441 RepID=UPI0005652F0A|nr:YbhB/YbcL family Raf kinase inhibitor-like protein [Stenoxybacter acetivorans]
MTTNFTLTSPEFKDGDKLDISYQADKDNQSPALVWQNAPTDTKSFAVAMHDPDAPTGGAGWWHWLAFGIPAELTELPRNAGAVGGVNMPAGVRQMRNTGGALGYGGCYPPVGDPAHRYIITVYALDTDKPDIAEDATTSMAGFVINAHAIAKASLTVYYAR